MARYTGPSTKIARKFGEPIFGTDKDFEKRNYPPGQHGLASKRKKKSEYGTQLKEKQKVKYTYGLLERQFRNLYEKASRMKGQKGENLIILLESRLDNIVYLGAENRVGSVEFEFRQHVQQGRAFRKGLAGLIIDAVYLYHGYEYCFNYP